MKRKIKVAAIQMEIKPLDISANLRKAEKILDEIFSKNKCNLVVFPEDFITGPIERNLELAQNEDSDSIKFFKTLAKKFNTFIVCGSVIKKVGDSYFNTSFLINNKGKIILEYEKNNLWHSERPYLTPGKDIQVAKTPIGNIGIIICWDLAFPNVCQKLAQFGVDIICCPSYWTTQDGKMLQKKYGLLTENNFVNNLCPARAIENEVLFIYANGAGKARINLKTKIWEADQIGQTQICTPIFGTVAKIENNREGFIIYEYDNQIAKDAERNYKIRQSLNNSYYLASE